MPLKLVAPKAARSPNWRIRGTYLGITIDRTTGTPNRALAQKILKTVREDIERGRVTRAGEPNFASAAMSYLDTGGDPRFLGPLNRWFAETPLSQIDQASVDAAAVGLYPDASPATRNRQVYTPLMAVLNHAGATLRVRRPKGAAGF